MSETTDWPERRGCFPGIFGDAAEQVARELLRRTTDAVYDHEADSIWVDVNDVALLCVAVLSVGCSSRPADVSETPENVHVG